MPLPDRLLLVDPDAASAQRVARALRGGGYAVIHASSCSAARALALRFEVGIFELELDDGWGDDLAGELLALGRVQRVLFLSVGTKRERLLNAARLGRLLDSPCSADELVAAVRMARRPTTAVPPSRLPGIRNAPGKAG